MATEVCNALAVILLAVLSTQAADALTCYKCDDLEFKSGSKTIQDMFGGKTDPNCGWGVGASTTECPDDGEHKCVLYKGKMSGSLLLFGSFETKTYIRDCIKVSLYESDGCTGQSDADKMGKELAGKALGFLVGISNMKVDGTACLCSDDLCNPDPCEDGEVNMFNTVCLQIWVICTAVGGLVLLIAMLTCCCCCCGCCRKNPRPIGMPGGVVIHTSSAPGYVQMSSPVHEETASGMHNMTNPGYVDVTKGPDYSY